MNRSDANSFPLKARFFGKENNCLYLANRDTFFLRIPKEKIIFNQTAFIGCNLGLNFSIMNWYFESFLVQNLRDLRLEP
jgi:hypothetical protein